MCNEDECCELFTWLIQATNNNDIEWTTKSELYGPGRFHSFSTKKFAYRWDYPVLEVANISAFRNSEDKFILVRCGIQKQVLLEEAVVKQVLQIEIEEEKARERLGCDYISESLFKSPFYNPN